MWSWLILCSATVDLWLWQSYMSIMLFWFGVGWTDRFVQYKPFRTHMGCCIHPVFLIPMNPWPVSKVYRKPTHTNPYLHQNSHHHPANKQSVLTSLIHRAKALCDENSLTQELEFLTTLFKDNGYSPQQIRRAMEPATRTAKTNDKPASTAYIPYTQTTYSRLSRMLAKHNIKSVTLPPRKIFSYFPPVKDSLGLRTPGVYGIPCECGRVYIGQSGDTSNSESKITTDI
jgi:hypothetical protein